MVGRYPHKHIAEEVKGITKIEKMDVVQADKAIAETPRRKLGEWKVLLDTLVKENKGAKVTDLSRGQVAALVRQAKVGNFSAVAADKYTAVFLSPPVVKKQVPK